MTTFAAQVGDWVLRVHEALDVVFKESAQEVVSELDTLVPRDTGFLRASLHGSASPLPPLQLENPEEDAAIKALEASNGAEILLVINDAEAGDTIYLGYSANYAAFAHWGANGRPGKPWVSMVAQRWPAIVNAKAAMVKSRLGL